MTFQPLLPLTGYSGWKVLERTLGPQQNAFANSASVSRLTDTFKERIPTIQNAQQLVNDRELLTVALGAFGLQDDLNNRFFIRTILEEGTSDPESLANRLADKRYAAFSEAFDFFGSGVSRLQNPAFAEDVVSRFERQQFARAVGEQDNNMRLALNAGEALTQVAAQNKTEGGRWFAIMGNPPLREVFEVALGLPKAIVGIDLDRQREVFQEKARSAFGTDDIDELLTPAGLDQIRRLFLVRTEAADVLGATSGRNALTLLQSGPINPGNRTLG
ncbi:DUF1217 domain-containing protein [Yoonia litorea]|uniref:Flagellar protein n=1 Tax=Yoonia litorea TaxID=1123755 RepID=A0A1I6MU74_9RHOB|nr:DUF1217 domain-containing protein [Yoonia litorea]SFS19194.1 Protein of unknown function [Yoonia litorea]